MGMNGEQMPRGGFASVSRGVTRNVTRFRRHNYAWGRLARIPPVTRTARDGPRTSQKYWAPGEILPAAWRVNTLSIRVEQTALYGSMSSQKKKKKKMKKNKKNDRGICATWLAIFHGNNPGLMIDQLIPTLWFRNWPVPPGTRWQPPREILFLHNIDVNLAPFFDRETIDFAKHRFQI